MEQDRMRAQFLAELAALLREQVTLSVRQFFAAATTDVPISAAVEAVTLGVEAQSVVVNAWTAQWLSFFRSSSATQLFRSDVALLCSALHTRYRQRTEDLLRRQQMELDGANAADLISGSALSGKITAGITPPPLLPLSHNNNSAIMWTPRVAYRHAALHDSVIIEQLHIEFLKQLDNTNRHQL
jgi:hypothetical protein